LTARAGRRGCCAPCGIGCTQGPGDAPACPAEPPPATELAPASPPPRSWVAANTPASVTPLRTDSPSKSRFIRALPKGPRGSQAELPGRERLPVIGPRGEREVRRLDRPPPTSNASGPRANEPREDRVSSRSNTARLERFWPLAAMQLAAAAK
jgi:hypothetical protein